MRQSVQPDTIFNIRRCWELLANNVASVFNYPEFSVPKSVFQTFLKYLLISQTPLNMKARARNNFLLLQFCINILKNEFLDFLLYRVCFQRLDD